MGHYDDYYHYDHIEAQKKEDERIEKQFKENIEKLSIHQKRFLNKILPHIDKYIEIIEPLKKLFK